MLGEEVKEKMNSQRQVSTFAIALLMAGLVIGIGLSVSTCYATEPEDLPWSNETDVIILPPPPPLPITNETDPVIIVTDQDLASIQLQLYNIYDWMLIHDDLMMNSRSSVREINATLNDTIVNFVGVVEDLGWKLLDSDAQLQGQIDTQGTVIDELRQEVSQLNQELMNERAMRNNITIMFGLFSAIVIVMTYVMSKK
jgi:hypothetical protein